MNYYTARAAQILCLEESEVTRLHAVEKNAGYLLANWNIQTLFGKPEIKTMLGMSEDPEKQASLISQLENQIKAKGLVRAEDESIFSIDWYHHYDWAVFHLKNFLTGSLGSGKGSNLGSKLRKAIQVSA